MRLWVRSSKNISHQAPIWRAINSIQFRGSQTKRLASQLFIVSTQPFRTTARYPAEFQSHSMYFWIQTHSPPLWLSVETVTWNCDKFFKFSYLPLLFWLRPVFMFGTYSDRLWLHAYIFLLLAILFVGTMPTWLPIASNTNPNPGWLNFLSLSNFPWTDGMSLLAFFPSMWVVIFIAPGG